MNRSTYKRLYEVNLGVVNKKDLIESEKEETNSYYKTLLHLAREDRNMPVFPWDVKLFTTEFLSASPRQRLDETFFAFVLKIVYNLKHESFVRTYQKPETHQALMAWVSIVRSVIYSGLGLLYNFKWTDNSIMNHLEPTITQLFSSGNGSTLRKLMVDLGVQLHQEEPYQAERLYEVLGFLHIGQFSSFYWRYLHWMAEATAFRGEDMNHYKNEWLKLLKGPLYRTLDCQICKLHFKSLLDEYGNQMSFENLPQIFFKIHNRTHAYRREGLKVTVLLQEPDYTESQYEADSEFMRRALVG